MSTTNVSDELAGGTAAPRPRTEPSKANEREKIEFPRRFTRPEVSPYDELDWETRSATINKESGEVVFEQTDIEVPRPWSQMATNVVVSKYFRGQIGTPERENSVRQLIGRVVDTITSWGDGSGVTSPPWTDVARPSRIRARSICWSTQRAAFNSPVWFNVGVEEQPAVLGLLHQLGSTTG